MRPRDGAMRPHSTGWGRFIRAANLALPIRHWPSATTRWPRRRTMRPPRRRSACAATHLRPPTPSPPIQSSRKRSPHLRPCRPLLCLTRSRPSPIWPASTRPAPRWNPVRRPAQASPKRGAPPPQQPSQPAHPAHRALRKPMRRQAPPHPNPLRVQKAVTSSPVCLRNSKAPTRRRPQVKPRPDSALRVARYGGDLSCPPKLPPRMHERPRMQDLLVKVSARKRLPPARLRLRRRNRQRRADSSLHQNPRPVVGR